MNVIGPQLEDLSKCVHCGFCLQSCPTYIETGLETESPRGRLYLMRAHAEGRIPLTDRFLEHIDLCLGCRNCEAVCPSEVPYGHIIEQEREVLQTLRPASWRQRLVRGLVFRQLLPHPSRLRLMARLLRGLGHEVSTASTIAEATETERSGDFDLIVSDIGLPDGSGLDLMRRVVARRGPIPAIALTGYGMEEDIRRSREAGFTAHMTKPIDFNKLEAMIRQVAG